MNVSKADVLNALTDFAHRRPAQIPPVLEEYLCYIAKTGDTLFSWKKLRPLMLRKVELVIDVFHELSPTHDLPTLPNVEPFKFEEMKEQILEAINNFDSAPFTIQRLCELVVDPWREYKRTDKFMRAVEKNVRVVSTIQPRSHALEASGVPGAEDGAIGGHFSGRP